MATLSKAAFLVKWADVLGTFADNTTRQISEGNLREFSEDIADSLFGVTQAGSVTFATIDIGDWDMDTDDTKIIDISSLGITYTDIRHTLVTVRADTGASIPLSPWTFPAVSAGVVQGWAGPPLANDTIILSRLLAGTFDSTDYDSTGFNRGWITIGYVN